MSFNKCIQPCSYHLNKHRSCPSPKGGSSCPLLVKAYPQARWSPHLNWIQFVFSGVWHKQNHILCSPWCQTSHSPWGLWEALGLLCVSSSSSLFTEGYHSPLYRYQILLTHPPVDRRLPCFQLWVMALQTCAVFISLVTHSFLQLFTLRSLQIHVWLQ